MVKDTHVLCPHGRDLETCQSLVCHDIMEPPILKVMPLGFIYI